MSENRRPGSVPPPPAPPPTGTPLSSADGRTPASAPTLFELREVTRRFHRHDGSTFTAVNGVSLDIRAGERLGIVGESGSGKSTLVRMMDAVLAPSGGSITFRGRSIVGRRDAELADLRSSVSMIFQDPRSSLDPRMRVADIITEPLRSPVLRRHLDIRPGERLAQVLAQVGLPTDAERRYPHEFSGGQRQRIAIARAIIAKPEVLIADEAVSSLDVSVRAHVLNLLTELTAEYGLTLIFISHDLSVVRHVCDRVVVMRRGDVVEAGLIEQVYTDPQHPYTRELVASVPRIRLRGGTGRPSSASQP